MALNYIQQIKDTSGKAWDISAKYINGIPGDDLIDMIHGAIETYVIPTSKSSDSNYASIVNSTSATVTTTFGALKNLIDCSDPKGLRLGDVILMEATSDGTKVFDRWVSANSNDGTSPVSDSDSITLSVLETQVATHHHTIPTHTFTKTSAKVLTGVTIKTTTTNNVAYAGTDVPVLQGEAGDYVTSVTHDSSGKHTLSIANGTSTSGHAHSHTVTVSTHNHTVKFKPNTIVSRSINAYTSLQTGEYIPHTHSTVTAAGAATNSASFKYVNGGSTDTFLKSVTDASTTTNTGQNTTGTSTGYNTAGLSTSTQASTDTIGDVVKTTSAGAHTHSVSATTTENAIKTLSLAKNVTTSVKLNYTAPTVQGNVTTSVKLNYTAPTVQPNVVTSVTTANKTVVTSVGLSGTTTFVNTATVTDGVLSFGTATVGITSSTSTIKAVSTITSGTQSAGSASLSYTSGTQTYTSGTLTATCDTGSAGAHQHGFSHTHTIPSHNHTISAHTHTYVKTVASETGTAYKSLTSANHTPHTHSDSVTAAAAAAASTKFTYVKSGTSTAVVRDLLDTDYSSFTVGNTQPGATASTVYLSIAGTITFPGLTVGKKTITTTNVKPAVDSGEKPAMSLTLTSVSVVKTLTSAQTTANTSTNIGGSPA